MLVVVKKVYFPRNRFCGNYRVRLGHVTGAVYFALVVDLKFDLNAFIFGLARALDAGK